MINFFTKIFVTNSLIRVISLIFVVLCFFSHSSIFTIAQDGHINLLTVGNTENGSIGGVADLYLEIKDGSGKLFFDSTPLTELDTQISARFAKEIACDFLSVDCSNLDFFYTIKANSNVVGGPSAGAAITVLTIALLDDLPLKSDVVMTGTINSGGIIGPVSGIKEKAVAAKDRGFNTVLIPKWSIIDTDYSSNLTDNSTPLLSINTSTQYADSLVIDGVDANTVSTIDEALFYFTGKNFSQNDKEITIPTRYQLIMQDIAQRLCERYLDIKDELTIEQLAEFNDTINSTSESYDKGLSAFNSQDFYSSASYCFSANSQIRNVEFSNLSNESISSLKDELLRNISSLNDFASSYKLAKISDLETQIIVKDRLYEARDILTNENFDANQLSYVLERYNSAVVWSRFFNYHSGDDLNLDNSYLSQACLSKILEVEDRLSYIELLFGVDSFRRDRLNTIRSYYDDKDYSFCLFSASKFKAEISSVLSSLAVTQQKLPELVQDKLFLAKKQINKQTTTFPILGYSYYSYANSLSEDSPDLALLFSEYALEFSDLDLYFPKKQSIIISASNSIYFIFVAGIAVGLFLAFILDICHILYIRFKK